jgi:hypothetical protein
MAVMAERESATWPIPLDRRTKALMPCTRYTATATPKKKRPIASHPTEYVDHSHISAQPITRTPQITR